MKNFKQFVTEVATDQSYRRKLIAHARESIHKIKSSPYGTEHHYEFIKLNSTGRAVIQHIKTKNKSTLNPVATAKLLNGDYRETLKEESDHTDRVVHHKGHFWVDREDTESGKQISKPGQKIKFTHKGKKYSGTVSDEARGRDDDVYKVHLPGVNYKTKD